jgi:hypothetical protein
MVLHLAEHLDVPLRDRNHLLLSAGYAPTFRQSDLSDPSFASVRAALDRVLAGHQPYPAIVVDRRWDLVTSNQAATILVDGVPPELLEPPVNVMRLGLHPAGLASRIANLEEWADHIVGRVRRQVALTGDEDLADLAIELDGYVAEMGVRPVPTWREGPDEVATPLLLDTRWGRLALLTTVTTFGTALDITLSELALEALLPADEATAACLADYARDSN